MAIFLKLLKKPRGTISQLVKQLLIILCQSCSLVNDTAIAMLTSVNSLIKIILLIEVN